VDKMLISVIIPVYNGATYLRESVMSALAQTYDQLEVIIVDDGSTDESGSIARAMTDERIKYIRTENHGVSSARNTGISYARGTWLAFLDADDVWESAKLTRQAGYFADYDLVCSNASLIASTGATGLLLSQAQIQAMNDRGIFALLEGGHPPMSSVCLRKSSLGKMRFTEGQRFAEDFDLWLRVVASGARLRAAEEPLYRYRLHEGSASAQTPDARLRVAEVLVRFSQQPGLSSEVVNAARTSARYSFYHHCQLVRSSGGSRRLLHLALRASSFDASFMKVLLFAIMKPLR
jgi:Glycosyl transferase family 2